jgi:RimJ/RimL family protein N-acetyltransferase
MFARTERLLLRPGWPEDAPALAAAIGDKAIVSKLATAPWPYDIEDAEEFLRKPRATGTADFLIFARTCGSPRLVGGIGLAQADGGEIELGYWIARPYWGLGFATEAGRAVMALADQGLKLPHIVAGHFVDNPGSGRVLRKLGFAPTGNSGTRFCKARGALLPYVAFRREAGAEVAPDLDSAMAA